MPITPGFWTHINDLLGVGKQELVMDGDRANSLKAFVKRALPSQKCLVKQVSLAVRLDPDILGSHRLHFIWHTQPEEKSLGEGGRQSRVRVRAGTQRWRMPLTTRPSPRLCVFYDSQRERLWEVDELVCLGRSLVGQPASRRWKKKDAGLHEERIRKEQTREEPSLKIHQRFPLRRKGLTSEPAKRNQDAGPGPPLKTLLDLGGSSLSSSLAVGLGAGHVLSPHLCFPVCKVRKLICSGESSQGEPLGASRGGPGCKWPSQSASACFVSRKEFCRRRPTRGLLSRVISKVLSSLSLLFLQPGFPHWCSWV